MRILAGTLQVFKISFNNCRSFSPTREIDRPLRKKSSQGIIQLNVLSSAGASPRPLR
jgi:hypothetical protein